MIASITLTFGRVIEYIVAGLVIGALARLIVPGKQQMGILVTIALGIISAFLGGILWQAIFSGNKGIAWIGSIIVAVVLVALYSRFTAGGAAERRA